MMERIKDVTKIRMYQGSVLMKVVLKNQKIIAPDGNGVSNVTDHGIIVQVSPDVKDLEVGDIVLDFRSTDAFEWNGDKYAIIPRMNIRVAVPADQFDITKKKSNLKITN